MKSDDDDDDDDDDTRLSRFGCVVDGLDCWSVTANGGDEFVVEPENCPGSENISTIGISGEMLMLILYHIGDILSAYLRKYFFNTNNQLLL